MQELVYQHGIHSYFNSNIEALRDAVEVIGLHEMVNAYNSMAWGITEGGRLAVMITDRRPNGGHNSVIVEFQGDGCCTIHKCDAYGNTDENHDHDLFDTHWYISDKSVHIRFKKILETRYSVYY